MAKIGIILSGAASKGAYEYGFLKAFFNLLIFLAISS
jgi:predicted acylesterase/phospholipase RssA